MLLRSLDTLREDPVYFFTIVAAISVSLLIAITIHEFTHAFIAHRLGDSTAKRLGRLSLNPRVHLDPMGTAMLFLAGFGWGKPVPVNPAMLGRSWRQGMAFVSAGGPLSNIVTAALFALPINLGFMPWHSPFSALVFRRGPDFLLADLFGFIIFYNLVLAVFNLIPIAPLDGFKVVLGLLPGDVASHFSRVEPFGPVILLTVVMLDVLFGVGVLSAVMGPPINFLGEIILNGRIR